MAANKVVTWFDNQRLGENENVSGLESIRQQLSGLDRIVQSLDSARERATTRRTEEMKNGPKQPLRTELVHDYQRKLLQVSQEKDRLASQEMYLKKELRRILRSRENIQLEASRLHRDLKKAEGAAANASSREEESLRVMRTKFKAKEKELVSTLREALEKEELALEEASAAKEELRFMAKAPWDELKHTVQSLIRAAKQPLENANHILQESKNRTLAAETASAKIQETVCILRQQLEFKDRENRELSKICEEKQLKIDQLSDDGTASRKQIYDLKQSNAALRCELSHQTSKIRQLERQLRLLHLGVPDVPEMYSDKIIDRSRTLA